jgi:hypothetical protein
MTSRSFRCSFVSTTEHDIVHFVATKCGVLPPTETEASCARGLVPTVWSTIWRHHHCCNHIIAHLKALTVVVSWTRVLPEGCPVSCHSCSWDDLKLSHAPKRPGSNPGLPRATSFLFARAPGQVACWNSGAFPLTNCMCIPSLGARPHSKRVRRSHRMHYYSW